MTAMAMASMAARRTMLGANSAGSSLSAPPITNYWRDGEGGARGPCAMHVAAMPAPSPAQMMMIAVTLTTICQNLANRKQHSLATSWTLTRSTRF